MEPIPDEFVNAVVFLCREQQDGAIRPEATGFFVAAPVGDPERGRAHYVVTARHVVEGWHSDQIYVRLNRSDATYAEVPTRWADWVSAADADVAALLVTPYRLEDGAPITATSLRLEELVGPAPEYRYTATAGDLGPVDIQPQVGHQMFFVGLFTEHHGLERNLPSLGSATSHGCPTL